MEDGRASIAPNPYAHLNRAPHPVDVAANDPNHPMNRAPTAAPPFRPAGAAIGGNSHAVVGSGVNIPDRFELFLLAPGEKKITEASDNRTPNTSIFTLNKEDHTLGNLLRAHLLKDPHVMFAAYRVPHPLFATFELRVQTDGEVTPREALTACCKAIVGDLGQLSREFTKEFELRKMVGGEGAGPGAANAADK